MITLGKIGGDAGIRNLLDGVSTGTQGHVCETRRFAGSPGIPRLAPQLSTELSTEPLPLPPPALEFGFYG